MTDRAGAPPADGSMARFHHTDLGTSESTWLLDDAWDEVPVVGVVALLQRFDALVVVVAHPDDETVGPGATLAAAGLVGLPTTVVVATDGAHGAPKGSPWRGEPVAALRAQEVSDACAALHPGARLRRLDLPDEHLADHSLALADVVAEVVHGMTGRILLVTTYDADGHSDHAAAHAATRDALDRSDPHRERTTLLAAPIWAWLWGSPQELPWERCVALDVPNAARHARTRALGAHRSQVVGLGVGAEPLVGPRLRERVERVVETLVVEDRPGARDALLGAVEPSGALDRAGRVRRLDAMFDDGNEDPWGVEDSFYERRKRALTLAAPTRDRLGRVLEIGCATGVLTRELAPRSDAVVAVDVSAPALEVARRRDLPGVTWVEGRAPGVLGDPVVTGGAPYDVVVLSEVGYFLTGSEWLATLRGLSRLLAADGEVVLCHWQHPVRDLPLDGPAVHAQARAALGLPVRSSFRDGDVLIEVLGGPESLAREEGRR